MRGRCCAAARGGLSRAGGGRRTRTHAQPNSCSSRWRGDAPPPNEALQLTRPRSVPVRPHRSNPAALQLNLGVRRYAAASCRVKDTPSNSAATRSKAAVHDLTTLRRADLGASESAARSAFRAQANHSRGVKAVAATFAAVALAVLAWYACDAAGLSAWISVGAALSIATAFSVGLVQNLARDTRRILQHHQLACPHCGHEMLAIADLSGQLTAVDLTVETGRCSHCGKVSFAA